MSRDINRIPWGVGVHDPIRDIRMGWARTDMPPGDKSYVGELPMTDLGFQAALIPLLEKADVYFIDDERLPGKPAWAILPDREVLFVWEGTEDKRTCKPLMVITKHKGVERQTWVILITKRTYFGTAEGDGE